MSVRSAVVDEENRFLRWADRAEIHERRLPHRSVQVLLLDSRGRLVLQRRHQAKRTYPRHWDASASGHVEEPDYPDPSRPDHDLARVYDEVASRELLEELGVSADLERLGSFAPLEGVHYEHFVLYRGSHDGPYRPQAEEVEEVSVFTRADYRRLADDPSQLVTRSLRWLVAWGEERALLW